VRRFAGIPHDRRVTGRAAPVRAWCVTLAVLCASAVTFGAARTAALWCYSVSRTATASVSLATTVMLALVVLWVVMAPLYQPPGAVALHDGVA
jgi:hypothetical protein